MEGGGLDPQLPSNEELQDHLAASSPHPSASSMLEAERLPPGAHSHAPAGDTASEPIPPGAKSVDRSTSYKSPVELLSAPSSGRVTIAGRRLGTGEMVQPEVIHLQDFPAASSNSDAGEPQNMLPSTQQVFDCRAGLNAWPWHVPLSGKSEQQQQQYDSCCQ